MRPPPAFRASRSERIRRQRRIPTYLLKRKQKKNKKTTTKRLKKNQKEPKKKQQKRRYETGFGSEPHESLHQIRAPDKMIS